MDSRIKNGCAEGATNSSCAETQASRRGQAGMWSCELNEGDEECEWSTLAQSRDGIQASLCLEDR